MGAVIILVVAHTATAMAACEARGDTLAYYSVAKAWDWFPVLAYLHAHVGHLFFNNALQKRNHIDEMAVGEVVAKPVANLYAI